MPYGKSKFEILPPGIDLVGYKIDETLSDERGLSCIELLDQDVPGITAAFSILMAGPEHHYLVITTGGRDWFWYDFGSSDDIYCDEPSAGWSRSEIALVKRICRDAIRKFCAKQ